MASGSARQRRGGSMEDAAADVEQDGKRGSGSVAPAPAHFSQSEASEVPFSLDGDRGSLALLLLLYTLQGVPMGLASSVSFVLQERGGSYADQGALRTAPRRERRDGVSRLLHAATRVTR
jgi:PAT family acetyl-CoA transporter-like MFS transporter 1